MNAKGKKKRVRNSGEGGAVDEGCGATKRKRTEKGETDREEGKERRRTRETESEGHSERRIKKSQRGAREGRQRRTE